MEKRPLSLTIIMWLMAIGGIFGLYSVLTISSNPIALAMMQQSGAPIVLYQANGIIGCIVALVCAYGIYKGLPWSRVLYAAWGIIGIILSFITSPAISVIVIGIIFYLILVFFLFRPAANEWFQARGFELKRGGA